jgi:putative endonuclease
MAESHELGKKAEEFAVEFLISKGNRIMDRNWRHGHLELDIVCTDGKMLIVVEVKARRQSIFPHPEDVFTPMQERRIIQATEAYIFKNNIDIPVRFDLIAIVFGVTGFEIEHIEDAFSPGVE